MSRELFEFGQFRLDPTGRRLWLDEKAVAITPKALDTLILLVQNRESPLSREQLIAQVWPDTAAAEHNLNQCIAVLRKTLGDNPRQPVFIATLPGRGYAFVAEVRMSSSSVAIFPDEKLALASEDLRSEKPASEGEIIARPSFLVRAAGLAAIFLVVLAIAGRYVGRRLETAEAARKAVKPRTAVVVVNLENLTRRADVAWLSTALPEMLTTDLGAGGVLRTYPGDEIARAVSEVKPSSNGVSQELLDHLRLVLGAEYAVSGAYAVLSEGGQEHVRLDLRIQKTTDGSVIASVWQEGSKDDLFLLVTRTGVELRQDLGAGSVAAGDERNSRDTLPSNLAAERSYVAGLAKLRNSANSEAKNLLLQAVAADPLFPLAHMALADAWHGMGYQANEQAEAKRAWDLASGLSRENQLRIEARYSKTIQDWGKAMQDYRSLATFFPDNLDYVLDLAGTQIAGGKATEALATLAATGHRGSEQDPRLDFTEARAHGAMSDYRLAAQAAERAASNARDRGQRWLEEQALLYEAGALGSAGLQSRADAVAEKARLLCQELDDRAGLAVIYRWRGIARVGSDPEEAERNFEAALKIAHETGNLAEEENDLNGLAAVATNRGELHHADEIYSQMLASGRKRDNKWNIQMTLNNLGYDLLLEGRLDEARRMEEEAVAVSRESGQKVGIADGLSALGQILEMGGDLAGAQRDFDEAAAVFRNIGAEGTTAPALAGQAEILRDRDQLGESQERHGAALKYFSQGGDSFSAGLEQVGLARLALDQGRAADAATLAAKAMDEFHGQKSHEQEGLSEAILAEALARQGKQDEALAAAQRALGCVAHSEEILVSLQVQIAAAQARILAVQKQTTEWTTERTTGSIRRQLRAIAKEGDRRGLVALSLEARAVEAQLLHGEPEARTFLAKLEQQARAKGFLRIANIVKMSAVHS
jgi:DNA-binding winged helix-turn-helix (wHTH) protein/Tfp pilus assembly protein PilF